MKPKLLSLFSNLVHRKSTFLFNPGEQILVLIKTICSLQDKFGNDFKTFWFRFQNDIGTFLLPFLTLLVQTRPDAAQARWQTPPGAVHSSVVQTRPDSAQASVVETPPGIFEKQLRVSVIRGVDSKYALIALVPVD